MPTKIDVEDSLLREPARLITVDGHGLRPGVNLEDSVGLLDLLDAPDDPD